MHVVGVMLVVGDMLVIVVMLVVVVMRVVGTMLARSQTSRSSNVREKCGLQ
jgi:hypothetical protein